MHWDTPRMDVLSAAGAVGEPVGREEERVGAAARGLDDALVLQGLDEVRPVPAARVPEAQAAVLAATECVALALFGDHDRVPATARDAPTTATVSTRRASFHIRR
jgi:hypothetical protein